MGQIRISYRLRDCVELGFGAADPSAFLTHVEALQKEIDLDEIPVVLHFRIASAGGIRPENCHPFPLTSSEQVIRRLHCITEVGIAHNGTIHGYGNSLLSDTMQYIMLQIYPLSRAVPCFYRNRPAQPLVWFGDDRLIDKNGRIYRWCPEWDAAAAIENEKIEDENAVFDIDKAVFTEIYTENRSAE